jgi:hypothetical protein
VSRRRWIEREWSPGSRFQPVAGDLRGQDSGELVRFRLLGYAHRFFEAVSLAMLAARTLWSDLASDDVSRWRISPHRRGGAASAG